MIGLFFYIISVEQICKKRIVEGSTVTLYSLHKKIICVNLFLCNRLHIRGETKWLQYGMLQKKQEYL